MNFLTHYYLQKKEHDAFYTVGVTFPDIISLHNSKMICGQKLIDTIRQRNRLSQQEVSFLYGMKAHTRADYEFHTSALFRSQLKILSLYARQTGVQPVHEIIRHILFEILLDRLLVLRFENIVDQFYESYQKFHFEDINPLLSKFPGYDREKLFSYIERFLSVRFLERYSSYDGIVLSLVRTADSLNVPLEANTQLLADFVELSFVKSRSSLQHFFDTW